jgi:predicted transcriptional regulator
MMIENATVNTTAEGMEYVNIDGDKEVRFTAKIKFTMLKELIERLEENTPVKESLLNFVDKEIEKLNRKKGSPSADSKAGKEMAERAEIGVKILEYLNTQENPVKASVIANALHITTPKTTACIKPLVNEGKVFKTTGKRGIGMYSKA